MLVDRSFRNTIVALELVALGRLPLIVNAASTSVAPLAALSMARSPDIVSPLFKTNSLAVPPVGGLKILTLVRYGALFVGLPIDLIGSKMMTAAPVL